MRKIAVVGGGDSSEFEISLLKVQRQLLDALSDNYETYLINIRGLNWYWEDARWQGYSC